MNLILTLRILGALLLFLGGSLLCPLPFSFYYHDGAWMAFVLSAIICFTVGGLLFQFCKSPKELTVREGFAIVTFGWTVFAVFGALPYLISGSIPSPIDAVFETMSGFTTTGSTILTNIEGLPQSLLFWRALTHWLGGMGIIVLSLAILPMLGVGGMQLFKAEVPGPTADRLKPRIQDTAKMLWGVYFLLTVVECILLMFGGMSFFDAICHSFATLATGGFSTRNASVAAYDSSYIDGVITLFMILAGVNFALHFQVLRGKASEFFRSEELRVYLGIIAIATAIVMMSNWYGGIYSQPGENFRYSIFQVSSIMTTTGFGTADFELWPVLPQYIFLLLMFIGGCAGSTGGGMKVARIVLLFKHAQVQMFRLIHPRAIRLVKLGKRPVDKEVLHAILGFFALYIGIFVVGSLLVAATGMDFTSAGSAVIACLSNIGPGLGTVGPTDSFAYVPVFGKWVLIFCMLMGRLELFTVLVLFFPSFWRK
jgi:trk system potassium uptake protein TrkH